MTSFAFIFGVVPLMIASGAGAEMRRSLGIAVFSGMLGVTLFGIFLTPVFFYVDYGAERVAAVASAAARLGRLLLRWAAWWAGRRLLAGEARRRSRSPGRRSSAPAQAS